MFWFWLLFFPLLAQAATLPQPSDVVLLHEGVAEDAQSDYNYIFTVDGDDTIYTCQANRCSLIPFRDQALVNIVVYELPDGYQRVANLVDQSVLQEYQANAAHQYRVEGLETALTATASTRSYHTLTIQADGSIEREAVSQERNPAEIIPAAGSGWAWIWWLVGGSVVVGLGAGIVLWKRRF
ncbi:MAG: hypothetical protein HY565_03165 [Candidatus Kerfeldbacteria bacterium]|nr:hypothetical protein [Candidatus Kerfeldbacteria bacterium]